MTPIYLITGFLGSGKTTLLKQLLSEGTEQEKVVVIQNEFAQTSIDGTELKQQTNDVEIVEINNGSIFCSCLMGSFIDTLKRIVKEYSPSKIYLEASGLADPSTINQIMNEEELHETIYLDGSVCVVDALNYEIALGRMPRVLHQVRIADVILINKIDLVDENTSKLIQSKIKKLNPFAEVIQTSYCKLDGDLSFQKNQKGFHVFPSKSVGSERPDLQSTVLKTTKKIRYTELPKLLKELQDISIRAKGFILLNNNETVLFQSTFDHMNSENYPNYPGNTEITVIGEEVSLAKVNSIFNKYI